MASTIRLPYELGRLPIPHGEIIAGVSIFNSASRKRDRHTNSACSHADRTSRTKWRQQPAITWLFGSRNVTILGQIKPEPRDCGAWRSRGPADLAAGNRRSRFTEHRRHAFQIGMPGHRARNEPTGLSASAAYHHGGETFSTASVKSRQPCAMPTSCPAQHQRARYR